MKQRLRRVLAISGRPFSSNHPAEKLADDWWRLSIAVNDKTTL
jgi:hypothetical protein